MPIQESIPVPFRTLNSSTGSAGATSWMFACASSRLKPTMSVQRPSVNCSRNHLRVQMTDSARRNLLHPPRRTAESLRIAIGRQIAHQCGDRMAGLKPLQR
jgi:hypothetical protein